MLSATAALILIAQSTVSLEARASVTVVRAVAIDIENAELSDTADRHVSRDEAGTLWVEFS